MVVRNSPQLRSRRTRVLWAAGAAALAVSVLAIVLTVDGEALADAARSVTASPLRAGLALGAFAVAFVLRALAWRAVLPGLPLGHALAAIHAALGANHVLPLRMGEPVRVLSVVRRAGVPLDAATASTVTLRAADLAALLALGWLAAPSVVAGVLGSLAWVVLAVLAAACVAGLVWLRGLVRSRHGAVRLPGPAALAATTAAWLLEAVLVWQSAAWAGIHLTPAEAMLVTATAVAAQVGAVAPGGLGTYEVAAVAGYVALGHPAGAGLVAALTAHGLKTAYSLVTGALAVAVPAPGLLGRLRLPRVVLTPPAVPAGPGPVVLFLPAHDEEATVAQVVGRAPRTVAGRPVEVVVVDDGSGDRTAVRAAAAGARVVSLPSNQGLGAAVRHGLADATARGAAAVAFCDADGEYDPGELDRLVGPILAGEADYVVGSRFAGGPRRMLPHRRFGNAVLTRLLSFVARRRISDGQTGYRAFSRAAAEAAEVVHDYNYAQVLTLDLLGKGFRYAEVPISYSFREAGRSFVRLGRYLRRVVPAVYRELNTRPLQEV